MVRKKIYGMDKKNLRYKRKGECKRCGWCCEYRECEDLIYEDNVAICTIYEDRPQACKLFPQAPPILTEKCGFYFLDTWENNKIVKYGKDL